MPHYLTKVFINALESSLSLRSSYYKLHQPLCKTNTGLNALSFIFPQEIKRNIFPKLVNVLPCFDRILSCSRVKSNQISEYAFPCFKIILSRSRVKSNQIS